MLISLFGRFYMIFSPTFHPQNLQNSLLFIGKNGLFSKHRLSELASIWGPISVPKYIHFPSKIHQHPTKNRFLRASFLESTSALNFHRFSAIMRSKLPIIAKRNVLCFLPFLYPYIIVVSFLV